MNQGAKNIVEMYNSLIFPIWQKRHANLILKVFDNPKVPVKVLEINCRNGYLTYQIARLVPDKSSIIAVDASREMLNFAMEATLPFQNVIYFKKDSEITNFDKGVFDYVLLANSNIGKQSGSNIKRLREFLTDSGTLICTFVNKGGFNDFFAHFLDVLRRLGESEYVIAVESALDNLIEKDETDEVFGSYGFDVLREERRTISINFESGSTILAQPYFYFILLPVFRYAVSTIPYWEGITKRVKDLLIDVLEEKRLILTADISCVIASKPVI